MARPLQHQQPRPSGQAVSPTPVTPRGWPADVIELIMADHRKIRRLCEVLDDAARHGAASSSDWILAHIWDRLAELLEEHTWAEEEICYLPMSGSGSHPEEWRRDAVADHEDIREAIGETKLQPIGSALWWRPARAVMAVSVSHLNREESDMLTGWLPGLTVARRLELGHQWLAFIAARRLENTEQHAVIS